MTPIIIDANLPIVGATPTSGGLLDLLVRPWTPEEREQRAREAEAERRLTPAERWRAQGGARMEEPPPLLAFKPKPRAFYRVVGYKFFEDELTWHSHIQLHAHLACPIIGKWLRGGCRGAGGGRADRVYPPTPPTVAVERYDVLETPRPLRCNLCCGPLLDLPDQHWLERDLEYRWRFDYRWGDDDNHKKAHLRWRTFVGGLDGRRFLVWNGSEFRATEEAA
jgi:hypothetical protein